MEKDTRPLFQITEAAHACGLSRSTLLRMEEKGLLAPAYIAPDSGRRYYDNHNVARVLQIEKFKAMGLGTEEIAGYFASGGEVTDLLSMLEERLRELSRGVEELRLRAGGSGGLSIQLMTRADLHHIGADGLSGEPHWRHALPLSCVRAGTA